MADPNSDGCSSGRIGFPSRTAALIGIVRGSGETHPYPCKACGQFHLEQIPKRRVKVYPRKGPR